jgi:hypothetical protein
MRKQEARDDLPDPRADNCAPPAFLQAGDFHAAQRLRRQQNVMYAPLMGCPPVVIPVLLAMHAPRRVADKEGAHAKRSVTR